jgi:flavin-dependent dehydrogenase
VFFVGDSAGHCLPLTAEGIRTALYFGLACGRELRAVVEGRITRERALKRYGDFSAAHAKKFAWMLRAQQAAGLTTPSRSLATVIRCFENRRLCGWVFDRYLDIAPPAFVADGPRALTRSRLAAVSA